MIAMKRAITSLFLLAITHVCFATDYIASTVDEATNFLKKAKAGDRVLLKNGTYRDGAVKFQNTNATQAQPITFAAETPGKVFLEGSSTLSVSGNYITITGFTWRNGGDALGIRSVIELKTTHSTLIDCAIDNYNSKDTIDNKWVSIYGEYNTVTHCLFKDKRNLGATLTVWLTPGKEAHHTISYNYFNGRHNAPEADNGLESIRIGDSKTSFENSHCVVALNRFEDCDGEIEIISNKSFHNSYLHNTFYKSNGGLTLRHGNECLADGNFFDGGGKPLAYGVRFIGEGHVAINNYFYNLNAAPKETFRAPVTLVTGLVNTPINGYFQVKRAVVSDNIFVNCAGPNIRIGATPKRKGATLAPDTVTIKNNVFFADKGDGGEVYEEVRKASHLTIEENTIIGKELQASTKGFNRINSKGFKKEDFNCIKDSKGHAIASIACKIALPAYPSAGASWVDPLIVKEIAQRKYTFLRPKEVGPFWNAF